MAMEQREDVDPPAADRDEWQRAGAARRRDTSAAANRSEYVAERLAHMAGNRAPGDRLGTKVALRELCEVSVGTFNEGVKLAQSRGYVTSRSGPGGGIFAAALTPIVRLGNSVLALDREAASVADAVRMRDALDPLLIEDVLWHSSATDVRDMRTSLTAMADALDANDAVAFVKANWSLHARITAVSPNALLRSVYLSLLEIVMTQTLSLTPADHAPLPDYVKKRYDLAAELVDAIEARDHDTATRLILEHNQMLKNTPGDPQHV